MCLNTPTLGTARPTTEKKPQTPMGRRGGMDWTKMPTPQLRAQLEMDTRIAERHRRNWAAHANIAAKYEALPGAEAELISHLELRDEAAMMRNYFEQQCADEQAELDARQRDDEMQAAYEAETKDPEELMGKWKQGQDESDQCPDPFAEE